MGAFIFVFCGFVRPELTFWLIPGSSTQPGVNQTKVGQSEDGVRKPACLKRAQ